MTPVPPPRRTDEEGDWIVRQFVSADDLRRTPEEYVARHAHLLDGFSFHLFRFADAELGVWVARVGELLASPRDVERCRERYLTPAELADARRSATAHL